MDPNTEYIQRHNDGSGKQEKQDVSKDYKHMKPGVSIIVI